MKVVPHQVEKRGDMKAKHEPSGVTPEPAARRPKVTEQEETEKKEEPPSEIDLMNQKLEEIQQEAKTAKVMASYLIAQHAEASRDKAKKEMVIGGWTLFQATTDDADRQAAQLDYQSDSRERFIKEVAKKAGVSNNYYKDWLFSHQTRGDSLSPITVVTVTQPWQRSKMLDFAKKQQFGTNELKERFFINDREESSWDTIVAKFGKSVDTDTRQKDIKIQPQISLWDRVTAIPLKAGMTVAKDYGVLFKQNWRDHTLTEKNTGEYIMWAYFQPDIGQVTVHLSEKNIPLVTQFAQDFKMKFDSMLNTTSGKGKGKGKKGTGDSKAMDIDQVNMPLNQSSHARSSKYPFNLDVVILKDSESHWDTWKEAWQNAIAKANLPFSVGTPHDATI